MSMILGAIIALGILVTIHEFGHFWVARRCGVEVIRFSIGFGKPIVRWHDRLGTEFVIAMIPLGGYVKMLDEREAGQNIPEEKLPYTFNRKSVKQRIAIVVAGPLANFLLAFILFWIIAIIATQEPIPYVGKVLPESIAASVDLKPMSEIVAVDNVSTHTWEDVGLQLFRRLGETGYIELTVKENSELKTYQLPINSWLYGLKNPDVFSGVGIRPYRPPASIVLNDVLEGGAGYRAGLQAGDRVMQVDSQPITSAASLVETLQKKPKQQVLITYQRGQQSYSTPVVLDALPDDPSKGILGVQLVEELIWPETAMHEVSYGVVGGLTRSLSQTWSFSVVTLDSLRKMFTGQVSVKNLSGPITIVKVAGSSFKAGFLKFLKFLALFSISLGVLNLLPIPVLDGGHLLFYIIEWVRGRAISEKTQGFALQIGVFLMMGVMLFAVMNDLNWL